MYFDKICQEGDCTSGANVFIGQKYYCERHALYILSEQERAAQQAPAPDMASACPECGKTLYIQCDDPKCMYERPKWQASEKSSKRELANKIAQRACSVLEYTPSEIQWKKLVDGIEHELNRPTHTEADGLCRDCGKNPAMKGYDLCKECGL